MIEHVPTVPVSDLAGLPDDPDARTRRPPCATLAALPSVGAGAASALLDLSADVLAGMAESGVPGLATLARMVGAGWRVLSMEGMSPVVADPPARFVAVFHDRGGGHLRGPHGHVYGTVDRLVRAVGLALFTDGRGDDDAIAAGLAAAERAGVSLVIVDSDAGYLPRWLASFTIMRPGLRVLALGAFAPHLPPLADCLAEADHAPGYWQPGGHPLVRLSAPELDALIALQGPGFGALAMMMRDEGYALAVFSPNGPGLAEVPRPVVAVLSDRDEGAEDGHRGFDRDTVARLARAADAVVFTDHEDDDAAMLAGLAAVRERRGSLLFVDAPAERVPAWLDALQAMSPSLPVLLAGAFARPAVVN